MTNIQLLSKPYWNNTDIKEYLRCGLTKASQIHQAAARDYRGACIFNSRLVKRDSVLQAVGIDPKRELEMMEVMKQYEVVRTSEEST